MGEGILGERAKWSGGGVDAYVTTILPHSKKIDRERPDGKAWDEWNSVSPLVPTQATGALLAITCFAWLYTLQAHLTVTHKTTADLLILDYKIIIIIKKKPVNQIWSILNTMLHINMLAMARLLTAEERQSLMLHSIINRSLRKIILQNLQ